MLRTKTGKVFDKATKSVIYDLQKTNQQTKIIVSRNQHQWNPELQVAAKPALSGNIKSI